MVTRRNAQTSRFNTLEGNRRVVFSRSVLVVNPNNRFENTRFGIELEDERGAGESYATVYKRLAANANQLLAEQIYEFKHGHRVFVTERELEKVQKEYGLQY